MVRTLLILLILTACASQRTKYGKYSKKNDGGYEDKTLDENIRVVNFKANSNTKVDTAKKFGRFRATELCLQENFKLAHVLDVFDKTETKTVTRTSSNGYPSYYYGMSPYYNRYSSFGLGFSTMNYSSYNETLKYPEVEVIFECANEVYEPSIVFREVPPDEMKHLVKDLRGALQVEKIPKEALPTDFKLGDIVLYAEGARIQQIYHLLDLFHKSRTHTVRLEVMRDGVTKQGMVLKGHETTDKILGSQADLIKSVCKSKEMKEDKFCLSH